MSMSSILLYCLLASIVIRSSGLMHLGTATRVLSNFAPTFVKMRPTTGPGRRIAFLSALAESATSKSEFGQIFLDQKNVLLLNTLSTAINITDTVAFYVNFCDEAFNVYLNRVISDAEPESAKQVLGKIRYEINCARQRKLKEADQLLRGILAAGGLKQMEAKLAFHLRRADIDMAFMVILQLNIEDATVAGSEKAIQVMTHLRTLVIEYQDAMVSAPVRLLRLLVRENESMVRKQMLRQKLLIGNNTAAAGGGEDEEEKVKSRVVDLLESNDDAGAQQLVEKGSLLAMGADPKDTTVPQCEHIVVSAVQAWGGADVTVAELEDTIADVLSQMTGLNGGMTSEEDSGVGPEPSELEEKCTQLRIEISEVLLELETPKVSDQCD